MSANLHGFRDRIRYQAREGSHWLLVEGDPGSEVAVFLPDDETARFNTLRAIARECERAIETSCPHAAEAAQDVRHDFTDDTGGDYFPQSDNLARAKAALDAGRDLLDGLVR